MIDDTMLGINNRMFQPFIELDILGLCRYGAPLQVLLNLIILDDKGVCNQAIP